MKLTSLITAAAIAFASPAVFAHATHGQPQYGGIFGEAGAFQTELVLKDKAAVLYITVHGEPLSTKGASGKLTILDANGKTEVELKPADDNQLIAAFKVKPGKGAKVVASVTLPGKSPASVRYSIE
jgi:hypothetical protein